MLIVEATPTGFKELAKAQVLNNKQNTWVEPVYSNGLLYCKNNSGQLVCLDLSGK